MRLKDKEEVVVNLEASSPEELDKIFSDSPRETIESNVLVALSLYGKKVLVRQFDFPLLSKRELNNSIILDAVELFSAKTHEIEVDYQVTDQQERIKGVFIAMLKKDLREYLASIRKAGYIPLSITAKMLTYINSFLQEYKSEQANFCFLDFSNGNIVNLSVFNEGKCELLRMIYFEDLDEAEREIKDSLHYFSGKSSIKQLEKMYFVGKDPGLNKLITNLKDRLALDTEEIGLKIDKFTPKEKSLFNLNLGRKYIITLSMRRIIRYTLDIFIAVLFAASFVLAIEVVKSNFEIRKINSSYNTQDYNKAVGLKDKISSIKNAK